MGYIQLYENTFLIQPGAELQKGQLVIVENGNNTKDYKLGEVCVLIEDNIQDGRHEWVDKCLPIFPNGSGFYDVKWHPHYKEFYKITAGGYNGIMASQLYKIIGSTNDKLNEKYSLIKISDD